MNKRSKLIFIGNYKGGVGKTTTTLNLSIELAKRNFKVLAIDLDPQSSLSEILVSTNKSENNSYFSNELKDVPNEKTINYVFDIYIRKITNFNNFIPDFNEIQSEYVNSQASFDFIPCSMFYRYNKDSKIGIGLDDIIMNMKNSVDYYSILPMFLNNLLNEIHYDYVIIDCPPTNNIITNSTFLLSDYYLIPTICDGLSTNGVIHYILKISKIYDEFCCKSDNADIHKMLFGGRPKCLGIFYNLIRQTVNYNEEKKVLENELKNNFEDNYEIYEGFTNNYVDTARNTARGIASTQEFSKIVDWLVKKLEK